MSELRAMPANAIVRLERAILWLYGPDAPWLHLLFGGFSAGWAITLCLNPSLFDAGMYGAIAWLPDPAWIFGHTVLIILHAIGVARPHWRRLRAVACLGTAWCWIVLALTFLLANGLTPAAFLYGLIGILGVTCALFVAWQRTR